MMEPQQNPGYKHQVVGQVFAILAQIKQLQAVTAELATAVLGEPAQHLADCRQSLLAANRYLLKCGVMIEQGRLGPEEPPLTGDRPDEPVGEDHGEEEGDEQDEAEAEA